MKEESGKFKMLNPKRLIASLKQREFQDQLFFQFLLLVTLPLIIMGIVSYNIYIRGESAKNELMLESYSENISMEYENIFSSIKEYYLDGMNSETYKWLVRQDQIPYSSYTEVRQAQNLLQGNYFMLKYINNYNFLNIKEGWILNKYGMFPYKDIENIEEMDRFVQEQSRQISSLYWLNQEHGYQNEGQGSLKSSTHLDISGVNLVLSGGSHLGQASNMLVVQLDMEAFRMVASTYKRVGYDLLILNGDEILLETNENMTASFLKAAQRESGIYRSEAGQKYNINVIDSQRNGITYVIGYDTNLEKQSGTVFLYAAVIIIICFGLLLILLRFTARSFSKPFVLLQKFAADQGHQIRQLLMSNLIKGEMNDEKIREELQRCQITPLYTYRILGFACKAVSAEEWKQLQGKILMNLPEEIKEALFIVPVIHENTIVLLIGDEDDSIIDNKTALIYKQVKDYVIETYGHQVAFGISRIFHKLTNVRRAFSECLEALYSPRNKQDDVNTTLVLYDDYPMQDSAGNVYDRIMEDELCNAIAANDQAEAGRLLELIVKRMEYRGVIGLERSFYITRLLMAILEIPGKDAISLLDIFGDEQFNIMNRASQIYSSEELIGYIEAEMIQPIMKCLEENRQQEVSDIMKTVTRMIQESKGNITLNECADALNYHPNYICKVLKKEKGITFTEMANDQKLKLSKYMLLTSNESIASISEKLHYNNVQNFIRFFKKQVGTTPSAFRKNHKEDSIR